MDLHKIHTGHPIRHWISALVAVSTSIVFGLLNQWITHLETWWQFAILSLCLHLALFDPIWNGFNHKPLFYQGDPSNPERAWTDKIWSYVPPLGQLLFRGWFIGVGLGVFFHLDWITGK
jgi:hypothetical protein